MIAKKCVFAVAAAALLAVGAPAQTQREQQRESTQTNQSRPEQTGAVVRIEQLLNDPEQYMGKTVTLEGEVDAIFGPHTFLIENETAGPDPNILVVSLVPYWQVTGPLNTFSEVELNGQLQKYTRADFERIHGEIGIPKDVDVSSRPVFLIGIEEHRQAMQQSGPGSARTEDQASRSAGRQDRTPAGESAAERAGMPVYDLSLDSLLDDPAKYYGKMVRVSGEVDDIESTYAFVMEDNDILADDDILVLSLVPLSQVVPNLAKDREVTVTGMVRRLAIGEFEWSREKFAIDEDLWNEFHGRSVLLIGMDEAKREARR